MKMILILTTVLTFVCSPALAGFRVLTSSADLGLVYEMQCSTGVTCSKTGGKLIVSSSPTLVSALTLSGDEATDAIINMAADQADDNGDTWSLRSVASGNAFTFSNNVSGSQVTKLSIAASTGNVSMVGSLIGDGGDSLVGFRQSQVAATAVTATVAQCGATFINSGAVEVDLPEASTALGCRYTFITGHASNFDVDPEDSDQIAVLTNAAGDKIRNATVGNSVTLEAISASLWAVVAVYGTWSDAD